MLAMIFSLVHAPAQVIYPAEAQVSDEELMKQAREDRAMFAHLYNRYFAAVYKYCLRRVNSKEDAEDLTSLVFTRALTGLGDYKGGSVPAWLFKIAHNAIANHYRDRKYAISVDDPSVADAHQLAATDEDGLTRVLHQEEVAYVRGLVSRLPEEQRELLALRITAGMSAKDAGVILGKSESAIRVALHRIKNTLRAAYQQREQEQEPEKKPEEVR